jgi:hypothetical protein
MTASAGSTMMGPMRLRPPFGIAVLALVLAAGQGASAAVGNAKLAQYLVADPIGGVPYSPAKLETFVTTEKKVTSVFDPQIAVVAQGWSNATTHALLLEVVDDSSQDIARPGLNAKETLTSLCGSAGGTAGTFKNVAGVANGYETDCRSLVQPNAERLQVLCFVKKNVLVIFLGPNSPTVSPSALAAIAKQQNELIPGAGIPNATLH